MNRLLKNMVYHTPWLFSNRRFLELSFGLHMGYPACLDNPETFNQKIQWLKLHDRKAEYASMVDKAAAKDYVAGIIGSSHIVPTIGIYDRAKDIPWDELPRQFVLKCTHDSGGLVICRDKDSLDKNLAEKKLRKGLRTRFYYRQREWAYKNVKPRIICEELLQDVRQKESLVDYKFFCFGGKAEFMYVSSGLEDHTKARISFTDLEGRPLEFHRRDYTPFEAGEIPVPSTLPEMVGIAEKIARSIGNPFVRIDLYEVNGKVYFSEITFYPNSGFIPFEPKEWDLKLGKMIKL